MTSSPLPFIPWTYPNSCNTALQKVMSSVGGATLSKEAGSGNFTRHHGTPTDPGYCSLGTQAYQSSSDVTPALVTTPEGNRASISFPLFYDIIFP